MRLSTGLISGRNAIVFAILLGIIGNLILLLYTNLLTVLVAGVGFFVYVVLYSLWKCRTIYGTAIGSIAGAVPPVVGYCAVSNRFRYGSPDFICDAGAMANAPLFFHCHAALSGLCRSRIPVLPISKGMFRTKIHMVLYILCFILSAALLTFYHYTGYVYLAVAVTFGLAWLGLCLKGFSSDNDQRWGYQMFRLSLILITAICFVIPFDTV